VAVYFI